MKLTVAKKIALLIAVAVFGLIGLGVMAYSQMNRVFESTNYANVNTVPSLREIDTAFAALSNMRAQLWQHIALTDKAKLAEIELLMDKERADAEVALKKYEAEDMSDDADRALMAANRANLQVFDDIIAKTKALSHDGKEVEAHDLVIANKDTIRKLYDGFNEHRQHNIELGQKAAADAIEIKSTATTITLSIVVVVVLLSSLIGWTIARSILNQLGGEPDYAAAVVAQVASGDFTVEVNTKPGDTTSLLYSMKMMAEQLLQQLGGEPAYASSVLKQVAEGDFTVKVDVDQMTPAACCFPFKPWSLSCRALLVKYVLLLTRCLQLLKKLVLPRKALARPLVNRRLRWKKLLLQ